MPPKLTNTAKRPRSGAKRVTGGHNAFFISTIEKELGKAEHSGREHMIFSLRRCLTSLRNCAVELWSGADAKQLKGVGDYVSRLLDRALASRDDNAPTSPINDTKKAAPVEQPVKRAKQDKQYVPKVKSAGWAIVVALHREQQPLTKSTLIAAAQPLTVTEMKPKSGSYYCGWSSMATLKKHDVVIEDKSVRPAKYSLSEYGVELGKLLDETAPPILPPLAPQSLPSSLPPSLPSLPPSLPLPSSLEIAPGSQLPAEMYKQREKEHRSKLAGDLSKTIAESDYTLVCLVDQREKRGAGWDSAQIVADLKHMGVNAEMSVLPLGDVLFILRGRDSVLVTPHVFERKQLGDLARSITDGRYVEQKMRLKSCGFDQAVLLVEGDTHTFQPVNMAGKHPLKASTLRRAMLFTMVNDGMRVVNTDNIMVSLSFIQSTYAVLCSMLQSYGVARLADFDSDKRSEDTAHDFLFRGMTWDEYVKICAKKGSNTIKEMFLRMLAQIPGISPDMATALVHQYPTPITLRRALASTDDHTALLGDIKAGGSKRLGPVRAQRIADLMGGDYIPHDDDDVLFVDMPML